MAAINQAYADNPDEVRETFGVVLDQANPLDWPAAVGPIIDVLSNEDWTGRPIVPISVSRKLAKDQVTPYTSQIMREVGKAIGVSPAQLEYLANTYSGGVYSRVSRTARTAQRLSGDDRISLSDYPVIGTLFLRDSYAPKAQIDKFYRRRDELSQLKQSEKITADQDEERLAIGRAARLLTPLWKSLRESRTESSRKALYKQIEAIIENPPKRKKTPTKKPLREMRQHGIE